MSKIDFDAIRRDRPLPEIITASGVKLAPDGKEFRACCPFHKEDTPSFTVFPTRAGHYKYHCFGCGAQGDVVDYVRERYAYRDGGEAARWLLGEDPDRRAVQPIERQAMSDPYAGYEILLPPDDEAPIVAMSNTPPILNPKRIDPRTGKPKVVIYRPKMVFPYRDEDGRLLGYVLRVEFDDKKITPGVWWTKNPAADFEGWSHGSFPAPRPLYGLDRLAEHPDWQVLLVEGEKCKDAADRVMKGKRVVPATWLGGGKALEKVDWKPLKGRSVIIWPDNDDEGYRTTFGYGSAGQWHRGLLDLLFLAGVTTIKIVELTRSARPDGWDIADAEREIGTTAIMLLIKERIVEWSREKFEAWKTKQIRDSAATPEEKAGHDQDAKPLRENPGIGKSGAQPAAPAVQAPAEGKPHVNGKHVLDQPAPNAIVIDEDTWRSHIVMKADNSGLKAKSLQNFTLFLQFDVRFRNIFAWNEFAKEVFLMRRPPWDTRPAWKPRPLRDTDVTAATSWLEYNGLSPTINDIGRVIVRIAEHNRFNPVCDNLDALQWDGVPRIDGAFTDAGETIEPWLSRYLGAPDIEVNRLFGRIWLIGAVARAYQPGCKFDTMLVLEGPQGLKKSAVLRELADAVGPHLFTDEMSDPNSKDAAMQMQGAWIVELAEMDAFRRADTSQIKSWLSRQYDRFRRPYGKIVETFPRSCVFAGTVNPQGIGYLKDATGGRRFLPVNTRDIDLDALKEDARQLWAEAVVRYRRGERWWIEDAEEKRIAAEAQQLRYEDDPYGEIIDERIRADQPTELTAQRVMDWLEIPKERRHNLAYRRIATHLHTRGWARRVSKETGKTTFVKPDGDKLL